MGLVRWYGRFRHHHQRPPARAARDNRAAPHRPPPGARARRTRRGARRPCRDRARPRSPRAPSASSAAVRCPSPGPQLHDARAGRVDGEPRDVVEDLLVPEEVLPPALLGAEAVSVEERARRGVPGHLRAAIPRPRSAGAPRLSARERVRSRRPRSWRRCRCRGGRREGRRGSSPRTRSRARAPPRGAGCSRRRRPRARRDRAGARRAARKSLCTSAPTIASW